MLLPVTEATPQFRDFHIRNVVCIGAEKGIFIRGLPEMKIQNINFENVFIQSNRGIEISEAANISLKNVSLLAAKTDPLINVGNSNNITFTSLKPLNEYKTFLNVSGVNAAGIQILKSQTPIAKEKITFSNGANLSSLTIK